MEPMWLFLFVCLFGWLLLLLLLFVCLLLLMFVCLFCSSFVFVFLTPDKVTAERVSDEGV